MNKIYMIYMAAGNSRRFSKNEKRENKLLYQINNIPMYQYGLQHLVEIAKEREDCFLLVVTQYEEIYDYAVANDIPVLWNQDSKLGVSYTIKAGISHFLGLGSNLSDYSYREPFSVDFAKACNSDYFLFMVADQPYIRKQTIMALIDEAEKKPETACISYNGIVGNPTLISARFVPELMELSGDEGGRKVIKRHHCSLVPAGSEEELVDIDEKI